MDAVEFGCSNGHAEVVRTLLEKGSNIEAASKDNWTPLNSAAKSGHFEVVKLLLEKKANMEAANKAGWTALISAAGSGHVECESGPSNQQLIFGNKRNPDSQIKSPSL